MGRTKTQTFDPHVMGSAFTERAIPETPMQALMEADFGCEPEESWEEKQVRFEALRDAIDEALDDRERWVIEAKFWRGLGLDLTARELGLSKTHVARIRDSALAKLAAYLEPGEPGSARALPSVGERDLEGEARSEQDEDDRGDPGDVGGSLRPVTA